MSRPLCEARRGPLGPGSPLLAGPRRRLSRVGIRASGRPRPELPRLARSSRSSLGLARRAALPPISGPGFPSSFPSSSLVSLPALPGRLAGLALFPASPSPRVPPGLVLSSLLRPCFHLFFLFRFLPGRLAARRRPLLPQRPKGQGNKGKPRSAGGRRPAWGVRRAVGAVSRGRAPGKGPFRSRSVRRCLAPGVRPFWRVPAAGVQLFR